MNTEKLTVPLKENGKLAFDLSRDFRKRKSRKMHILTGVTVFAIINISLFIATALTILRVKNLENEVDYLRNIIVDTKLRNDNLIKTIVDFENDDQYEEIVGEGIETDPEVFFGTLEEPSDSYYEDDYYDEFRQNDTEIFERDDGNEIIGTIKLATNLTKDGKEITRNKRNVIAATQDGVVINSESYAERKATNNTRSNPYRKHSITQVPAQPSSFGSPPWMPSQRYGSDIPPSAGRTTSYGPTRTPSVFIKQSRVKKQREDRSKAFRQVVPKASLRSGDSFSDETTADPDFSIVQSGMRRVRMGRIKLPAVHYEGDTSKYSESHSNYRGNGRLRHSHRIFRDWKITDWAASTGMDAYFTMTDGILTVKEAGVYLVYGQVHYSDEHDKNGFKINKNGDVFLQCTVTIHARDVSHISNTCHTSGLQYLSEGDTITLSDIVSGRYSVFLPGHSFFGLIKISDIKIQ